MLASWCARNLENHRIFQLQCFSWNHWSPTGAISCDEFGRCLRTLFCIKFHTSVQITWVPVLLGPLESVWFTSLLVSFLWVWFYHRFGWCLRLYPQVSKIHWWLFLSFRKYVPFTLFCINSHANSLLAGCRVAAASSLSSSPWHLDTIGQNRFEKKSPKRQTKVECDSQYKVFELFLIMNFGLTRWCLMSTKWKSTFGGEPAMLLRCSVTERKLLQELPPSTLPEGWWVC